MVKKRKSQMELAKETVGVGVASMAGMGMMGAMSSVPGMPAASGTVVNATSAGLGLVNVGQMAKVGMSLTDSMRQKRMRKHKHSKYVDRILG